MQFICDKEKIYEAVLNVSKAVAAKSTIPVLEGIKFKLNENILELTGYDLELGIKIEIEVKSDDIGEIIINAKLFSDIVKNIYTDEILIDVNDNLQVKIKGGNTEYTIPATSSVEYPQLPEAENGDNFSISQATLKNMINQTIFAVAQNDYRPIAKGELFEISDGVFNMVALDGSRLALRTEVTKSENNMSFVVPSKTLLEISKLLKDDEELLCHIKTSETGKHIIFEINGYFVFSRLLEGEFTNYKSSVPKGVTTEVIIDRKNLLKSLEKTIPLISERIKSPVICVMENDVIKLSCETAIGKMYDEIRADITGPKTRIGFNSRYFIEPLRTVTDDKVRLILNGSNIGMQIKPINGDSYMFLVLPVRIGF